MLRIARFLLPVLCLMLLFPALVKAQRGRPAASTPKAHPTMRPAHPTVTHQAHANYASMPRWGATVKSVPEGAVAYKYRRDPYYYHNGAYYRPHASGYVVSRPHWGLHVNILPTGYRTIAVGPSSYYYYYGSFYQPYNGGYTIVAPPVGAVVDSLPDGYTVETLRGNEYYVIDGVTYAEVDAPEYPDGVGYQVISVN